MSLYVVTVLIHHLQKMMCLFHMIRDMHENVYNRYTDTHSYVPLEVHGIVLKLHYFYTEVHSRMASSSEHNLRCPSVQCLYKVCKMQLDTFHFINVKCACSNDRSPVMIVKYC